MRIHLTIAIVFTLASTFSHAASFDCNKASNFIEKAICNDQLLSMLDETLNKNYKTMSAANIGDGARKDLKSTQRAWLGMRNKCTDNTCLINSYKKRVDEICEDYPVLSGVFPTCKSSDDLDTEGTAKPQQIPAQASQERTKVQQVSPQKVAVKNVQKIKQLKLPPNFVNSTLYVNHLGQWKEFMPCDKWLGLLFENKKIASIKGISANGNPGILIKRSGQPAFGLLFRMEGKEAFTDSIVADDEVVKIESDASHSQIAVGMLALTDENEMQ